MKTITIAKGDGIGPEISDAVLKIIKASGVKITRIINQKNLRELFLKVFYILCFRANFLI
jgi:isocitrate/isopropylmalate dehydrogenase